MWGDCCCGGGGVLVLGSAASSPVRGIVCIIVIVDSVVVKGVDFAAPAAELISGRHCYCWL